MPHNRMPPLKRDYDDMTMELAKLKPVQRTALRNLLGQKHQIDGLWISRIGWMTDVRCVMNGIYHTVRLGQDGSIVSHEEDKV